MNLSVLFLPFSFKKISLPFKGLYKELNSNLQKKKRATRRNEGMMKVKVKKEGRRDGVKRVRE